LDLSFSLVVEVTLPEVDIHRDILLASFIPTAEMGLAKGNPDMLCSCRNCNPTTTHHRIGERARVHVDEVVAASS
jgi:hypothetical protein